MGNNQEDINDIIEQLKKESIPANNGELNETFEKSLIGKILSDDLLTNISEIIKLSYEDKYKLDNYSIIVELEDNIKDYLDYSEFVINLLKNENALNYLITKKYMIKDRPDYYLLSSNTNPVAIELIKRKLNQNPDTFVNWKELCKNPSAAEILIDERYREKLDFDALSSNTNPFVINFLYTEFYIEINWKNLSANESVSAVELLSKEIENGRKRNVYQQEVSRNSKAIELLKKYPDLVDIEGLCANTHEDAIKLFEEHIERKNHIFDKAIKDQHTLNYYQLNISRRNREYHEKAKVLNKEIESIRERKKQVEEKKEKYSAYYTDINNANKNFASGIKSLFVDTDNGAIDLLKEKTANNALIDSSNEDAIDLVKKEIITKIRKPDDEISAKSIKKEFELLKEGIFKKYINWCSLSANPSDNAFTFLKENMQNIKWRCMSDNTNVNAIELLKERVIVEDGLKVNGTYESINVHDKIDWVKLSSNPKAIDLILEKIKNDNSNLSEPKQISCSELATNPNIFVLSKKLGTGGAPRTPKTPRVPRSPRAVSPRTPKAPRMTRAVSPAPRTPKVATRRQHTLHNTRIVS